MSQPGVIDGLQFAGAAETLAGTLDAPQLPRLIRTQSARLAYRIDGRTDAEGRSWLRIMVSGSLVLVCQRCLGALEFPLAVDNELLLTRSEREIAEADDDIDRALAGRAMSVPQLVEDEVILALPIAARHERCGTWQARDSSPASPFAALAGLKRTR